VSKGSVTKMNFNVDELTIGQVKELLAQLEAVFGQVVRVSGRVRRKNPPKLTAEKIADIRQRLAGGESQRAIARVHGIAQSCVWKVAVGLSHH
jgi:hypothetical protein